jgi:hypothetical protein
MDDGADAEHLDEVDREHNLERRLSARQDAGLRAMVAPVGALPDLGPTPPAINGCALVALPVVLFVLGALVTAGTRGETIATALLSAGAGVVVAVVLHGVASKRQSDWLAQAAERVRDLLARDLVGGEIASDNGEIVWQADRYVCRAGGRVLFPPPQSAWPVPIRPGRYRLTWLAESGLLLSVAAILEPGAAHGRAYAAVLPLRAARIDFDAVLEALAQAHGFARAGLADLRGGRIPRDWVRRQVREALLVWAVLAGIAMGLTIVAFVLDGDLAQVLRKLWIVAGFGLLSGIPSLAVIVAVWRQARAGGVIAYEGAVRVADNAPQGDPPRMAYVAGADWIAVGDAGARALVEGLAYRVYYLRDPCMLLGIEPIDTVVSAVAPC